MASSSKEGRIMGDVVILEEEDDEVLRVPVGRAEEVAIDTRWCLVGKLLSVDIQRVIDGSPWTYDRKPFIFTRLKEGENPRFVEINHVDMWIQLHNLKSGNMTLSVVTALGNFIGSFVESDQNNFVGVWRDYSCWVRLDVRKPIKRRMKIINEDSSWYWVNFKYERLPTFCFICGIIGHSEKFCPRLFLKPLHLHEKPYSLELKATTQRRQSTFGAQNPEVMGELVGKFQDSTITHNQPQNEGYGKIKENMEVNGEESTLNVSNRGNFFDSSITNVIDSKRRRPDSIMGHVGSLEKNNSNEMDVMDHDIGEFPKNGSLAARFSGPVSHELLKLELSWAWEPTGQTILSGPCVPKEA
uniref:Zinc knuckle CX2CX4HX4C domain-containing protein n=1 Tax=Cannabis sativa TaxID=3483 RepID=A0A803NRU7_CANSA